MTAKVHHSQYWNIFNKFFPIIMNNSEMIYVR